MSFVASWEVVARFLLVLVAVVAAVAVSPFATRLELVCGCSPFDVLGRL